MDQLSNSGNIGIGDVYRVVTDLQQSFSELRTHMERVDTRAEFAEGKLADLESRLRLVEATSPGLRAGDSKELSGRIEALERFRYTLAGGLALLALFAAAIGSWLGSALHH